MEETDSLEDGDIAGLAAMFRIFGETLMEVHDEFHYAELQKAVDASKKEPAAAA